MMSEPLIYSHVPHKHISTTNRAYDGGPTDYDGLRAKVLFAVLKEKAGPNYDVKVTASAG